MPEVRQIDANAAADKIMHEVEVHADEIGIGAVAIMIAFARALRDETDFPTIEPEVRRGRWIAHDVIENMKCSECGEEYRMPFDFNANVYPYNFCPNCGAKMDLRTPTDAQLDEADNVMMGGADNDR